MDGGPHPVSDQCHPRSVFTLASGLEGAQHLNPKDCALNQQRADLGSCIMSEVEDAQAWCSCPASICTCVGMFCLLTTLSPQPG